MKNTLLVLVLFFIAKIGFCQQEAQFTHNMFNLMGVNPAYAGTEGTICATGLVRQQWVGFKDAEGNNIAPKTFLMSVDAPINFLHGGLGAVIVDDKLGFETNLNMKIAYSYYVSGVSGGDLAIGGQVGFLNKKVDFAKFKPVEPDPLLMGKAEESDFLTDVGLGVFYKVANEWYSGISVSQLLQTKGSIETTATALKRTFYITGGYQYVLPGNSSFEIDPSILIKTDFTSTQYDISGLLKYKSKFWGGVTYRVQDAIALMVGLRFRELQIGYSYDISTSSIGSKAKSSGSHEVMVKYCFKLELEHLQKSYKNSRLL